jgi:hypothetical protein
MSTLESAQLSARMKYIDQWFSSALVTQILGFSNEPEGTAKRNGYELFMMGYANLMILEHVPSGEVSIAELGLLRIENQNAKTAYAAQVQRLSNYLSETGFRSINDLVMILDANQGDFTEWIGSPAYTMNADLLIKNAREFNNFARLHQPFSTFLALIPNLQVVQDLYIRSADLFTDTLVDELIESTSLSPLKIKLKNHLMRASALLTIAYSLKEKLIELSADGARLIAHDAETSTRIENTPDMVSLSAVIKQNENTGHRYIHKAKALINSNPNEFGIQQSENPKSNFWV